MNSLNQNPTNFNNGNVKTKKQSYHPIPVFIISSLVLVYSLLVSCSKDDTTTVAEPEVIAEEVLPTLKLTSGSEDVFFGVVGAPGNGSLQHTVKATAPDGFVELKIYKVEDGVKSNYISFDTNGPDYDATTKSYTHNLSYIFTDNDVDKELSFIAEVIDANNNIETLDFAAATVKNSMLKSSFVLQTTTNDSYSASKSYYLFIKDDAIIPYIGSQATKEENDNYIAAILSYNEDSGLYLASATDIDEIYLTDNLLEISKTKFKSDEYSETKLKDDFNIYDTFTIEDNFEELDFDDKDERVQSLKEGARFYFKTKDNRLAIIQVVRITSETKTIKQINFDIFVTQ